MTIPLLTNQNPDDKNQEQIVITLNQLIEAWNEANPDDD